MEDIIFQLRSQAQFRLLSVMALDCGWSCHECQSVRALPYIPVPWQYLTSKLSFVLKWLSGEKKAYFQRSSSFDPGFSRNNCEVLQIENASLRSAAGCHIRAWYVYGWGILACHSSRIEDIIEFHSSTSFPSSFWWGQVLYLGIIGPVFDQEVLCDYWSKEELWKVCRIGSRNLVPGCKSDFVHLGLCMVPARCWELRDVSGFDIGWMSQTWSLILYREVSDRVCWPDFVFSLASVSNTLAISRIHSSLSAII